MKILISVSLIAALAILPACSNEFKEGAEAYKKKDYKTAFEKWKPLAEQGHDDAQYKMGRLYREGHGVEKDYVEAYKWYSIIAKKGYSGGYKYMATIEKYMTASEIAKAKEMADEWMAQHQ